MIPKDTQILRAEAFDNNDRDIQSFLFFRLSYLTGDIKNILPGKGVVLFF